MIGKCLVVKNQILQRAFFDRLQDKAVCAVDGCNDLYGTAFKLNGIRWAIPCADAAAEADFCINDWLLAVVHGDCKDWADFCAFSAPDAGIFRDFWNIIGRCYGLHRAELSCGLQCFTTAAAAVADKRWVFPDVFTDLYEIACVGAL